MIPKYRCFVGNKRMFEVEVIDFVEKEVQVPIYDKETGEYLASASFNFDDIILMQSTGLLDKNGKEIFEGDVIKYPCTWEVHGTDEPEFAFVDFKNTIPYANNGRTELTIDDQLLDGSEWELIGNIYENPELVEVE